MDALAHLLAAQPEAAAVGSAAAWLDHLAACPFAAPFDRALWAGFHADRLGYAFAGGYQAALARLVEHDAAALARLVEHDAAPPARRSLAVTESGGGHPRAIATRLEGGRLHGEKTFATLASVADRIFVLAARGAPPAGAERPDLVLVRVAPGAAGLTITERAATPFAPEIPHARLVFDGVAIAAEDVLPGDGYARYVKPFRTLEDTHVLAATLAHVVGEARRHGFARGVVEPALALIEALRALAGRAADAPEAHVALAGAFTAARRHLAEHAAAWEAAPAEVAERWRRDLPLTMIAEDARVARAAAAWRALGAAGRGGA